MNPSEKDSRLQDEIDANLKRAYDDVLNESVPDRFTALLAQLNAGANDDDTSQSGNDTPASEAGK